MSRGERMDYAIQKATELGVNEITPLFSSRCEVKLDPQRQTKRITHWQQIAISACEQSGRIDIPCIHAPQTLDTWIQNTLADVKLVLHPHQTKALESDRDDAKQELKADAEQERQIKKMQQMGEIQAGLDKEDARQELERAQALKDLDPQTILALQAQKLLELGEDKEAANILKAIAENSNTKSDDQKEMYEKILEETKEMQKTLTDTLLKNNQSMSKLAEKSLTGKIEPSAKPKIKNEKEQSEDKKNDSE